MKAEDRKDGTGKYTPVQRGAAIAGIVLLAGMYVAALVAALLDTPWAGRMLRLCLGLTVAVPVFLWICIWSVGRLTGRRTIASPDILNSDADERRRMEEALQRELSEETGIDTDRDL